jgi:hypothetical protein
MWIFTTSGFVSAVRNANNRTIIVRSRDRVSLELISSKFKAPIMPTPLADYPYRVFLEHDQFIAWVSDEASALNYRNFKSEVAAVRGKDFSRSLGAVWSTMHQIEDFLARRVN